jgi:hypothetical protein
LCRYTAGALNGAGDLNMREEPCLIVVDKANTVAAPSFYYVCARQSSIMLTVGLCTLNSFDP